MKIGVMTFWWSEDNYGQILQCYALQKYLRDQGHDAYLIRYDPRNDYIPTPLPVKLLKALNPVKLFRHIKSKINQKKIIREQKEHPRKFSEFRDQYIKQSEKIYYSWQELRDDPPEADMYIVGSDQVWNFENFSLKKCRKVMHAFFLDFGIPEIKRVAYAASWGVENIPETYINEIIPLMARFLYIGVREKIGMSLCNLCNYDKAKWVCDPTMLLRADCFRNIYKNDIVKQISKKFIFLYMLNNENTFNIDDLYLFVKKKKLDIIYVTGNGVIDGYDKCFATIPEWIYLIDKAEYIVTNSFHCCVFSTIFNKKYGVIPLRGKHKGMNTRINDLFQRYGIAERWLIDDFKILDQLYMISKKVETSMIDCINK